MAKITFIGAGSTVFAKNLMGDILSFPELGNVTLTLHDIDAKRLRTSMLDPHTAAELSLDQIWSLVDDLIEAHGEWLPAYH